MAEFILLWVPSMYSFSKKQFRQEWVNIQIWRIHLKTRTSLGEVTVVVSTSEITIYIRKRSRLQTSCVSNQQT